MYQSNFTHLGIDFPNAIFEVRAIQWQKEDFEEFYMEDGDQKSKWITKAETKAIVAVYANEGARLNRVQPLRQFLMNFDYSEENGDIIRQAYDALMQHDEFGGGKLTFVAV